RARRHHGPAPRLALPPRPPRGRLRLAHRPLPRRGALEGDARRAGAARPPPPPQPLSFSSPARPMRVETPPVLPTPSPVQLGYRMPAEWEPHTATWLTWPHCEETWPGKLESAFPAYLAMIDALRKGETVRVNVLDEDARERVC